MHTFCTTEDFENVVKAVAASAFVMSELPVILSLEVPPRLEPRGCAAPTSLLETIHPPHPQMHCSIVYQRLLVNMMLTHLKKALLPVRYFALGVLPLGPFPQVLHLLLFVPVRRT